MLQTPLASLNGIFLKATVALMAAFSLVSAQELGAGLLDAGTPVADSIQPVLGPNQPVAASSQNLSAPPSAEAAPVADSVQVAAPQDTSRQAEVADSVQVSVADSMSLPVRVSTVPDTAKGTPQQSSQVTLPSPFALSSSPVSAADSARQLKSVLYLGGGEHSPWYHLGVLYAIEAYSIPVDSVVGTSWGAYVGYLWAKGVPLDDIQRSLMDSYASRYVGHNAMDDLAKPKARTFELPLSQEGTPSLRHRFTIKADSSGHLSRDVKRLAPDSSDVNTSLGRLRLQEILYRAAGNFKIPFGVETCGGVVDGRAENVMASIPLAGNDSHGELCPYLALPLEDSESELAIISVAVPVREPSGYKLWQSPWQERLAKKAMLNMENQPGVIAQAHSVQDTSRGSWIQAGFSAFERRLAETSPVRDRAVNYSQMKSAAGDSLVYNPTFDGFSAEVQSVAKTYWNEDGHDMEAASSFAYALESRPAFDSVRLDMQPNGDVRLSSAVAPTFDVFAGGFGSSAIGPNVYGGLSMSYVDQMEFDVELSGFWGNHSYGVNPGIRVSRLWNRNWSLAIDYEWMKLTPLKSFLTRPDYYTIFSEQRSDLHMSVGYQLDDLQKLSLNFLFGHRTFGLCHKYYSQDEFETYPVSPSLQYELHSGDTDRWFSYDGYAVLLSAGMQSIGFEFGMNSVIPIYWIVSGEARYAKTFGNVFTLSGAVAGGADFYHEEGYGYVYPESFDYRLLDDCYRQKIRATPWSTEWYDSDLASHGYGMVRGSVGLHYGPVGAWVFGAYVKDFENNPMSSLGENRIILEPALRFAYKSLSAYMGMSRTVDSESIHDLKHTGQYKYFVRIGNYDFF